MTTEPAEAEFEEVVAAAVGTIPGIPRTHPHSHGRPVIAALAESGYVIVRASFEQETRAKVAADLRRAADGRREYANDGDPYRDLLIGEANTLESAATVAEDPARLRGLIPSWRWTAEEHASVAAGTRAALNVTQDRHCGHCGRDNATASAYETPLCHTDDPELPDCYRRVTVYSEPVGALLGDGPKPAGVEGITR